MARTVPSLRTWSAGETQVAAEWQTNAHDMGALLLHPPLFNGWQAAAQSIATSTWTSIAIDSASGDSDGGHSTISNNTQYVAQVSGVYYIHGTVAFVSNATGERAARLIYNGSPLAGLASMGGAVNGDVTAMTAAGLVFLAVGTYIEIQGWQTSGGAINTFTAADLTSQLTVRWVSA